MINFDGFSAINIAVRAGPIWAWLLIYGLDIAIGVFCFMLPHEIRKGRHDVQSPYRWISQVFTTMVGLHFFTIPLAAIMQLWEIRLFYCVTVFSTFAVCLYLVWSLNRRREK